MKYLLFVVSRNVIPHFALWTQCNMCNSERNQKFARVNDIIFDFSIDKCYLKNNFLKMIKYANEIAKKKYFSNRTEICQNIQHSSIQHSTSYNTK